MVLLKNDEQHAADQPDAVHKIAVIGANGHATPCSRQQRSERRLEQLPARLRDQRPHRRSRVAAACSPIRRKAIGPAAGIAAAAAAAPASP